MSAPPTLVDATDARVDLAAPPRRVASLVPSLSETVHALGAADRLVAVTEYCVAPPDGFPDAERVRGTKNPDTARIIELEPDLVLANLEENRERDVRRLREAGLTVHVSYPRTVDDAARTVADLGDLLGSERAAGAIVDRILAARDRVARERPDPPIPVLCPIWRRPWMALGEGCYAADLLATCGLETRPRTGERYPRIDPDALRREVAAVLLPSEPFPFTDDHRADFADWDVPVELVDGALLTWHGPRTPDGLERFLDLALELSGRGTR